MEHHEQRGRLHGQQIPGGRRARCRGCIGARRRRDGRRISKRSSSPPGASCSPALRARRAKARCCTSSSRTGRCCAPARSSKSCPGLIVTQHTGDGKANQYFLRGFNLDHGTDFLTRVEGMPVNMPTHGHGQGYMDLNFVIPELIERVDYHKGTYYPELGNFSAAGAAEFRYFDRLAPVRLADRRRGRLPPRRRRRVRCRSRAATCCSRSNTTRRTVPGSCRRTCSKANGVARYSRATDDRQLVAGLHGLRRRVDGDRPGSAARRARTARSAASAFVDPTQRRRVASLLAVRVRATATFGERRLEYSAWAMDYHLELFSNFTYALDPVNGDQFEQFDDRRACGRQPRLVAAASTTRRLAAEHGRRAAPRRHRAGRPLPHDRARAPRRRSARTRCARRRPGVWTGLETQLDGEVSQRGRLRYDTHRLRRGQRPRRKFRLRQRRPREPEAVARVRARGARRSSSWPRARASTATTSAARRSRWIPMDGVTPVDQVTPLVEADGMEAGLRTAILPRMQLSLALWQLEIDSELLFIGDGGATEASRPSRRRGVELGLYARPDGLDDRGRGPRLVGAALPRRRPGGRSHSRARSSAWLARRDLRPRRRLVRRRAAALSRPVGTDRGQQRARAGLDARQPRGGPPHQRAPEGSRSASTTRSTRTRATSGITTSAR